jgi:ABC-type transporter Mla subunit MlaD
MFLNSLVGNMTAKTGKSESKKSTESAAKKDQNKHDQEESKSQSKSSADSSEEMDMGEELDELLNMLEEEDLTDVDLEQAAEMIDEWQGVLSKSKDAQLKEVGASLKQLKKLVGNSKVKEEDLAEVLSQLGSQVDEYANNAERGFKTKLHRLGKALAGEGKELMSASDEDEE